MQLLVVACVCLVPAAAAQAAAPANDIPTAAMNVNVGWTSLTVLQDVVVQASDWGDATTGPEDANPLPSCTGSTGYRSMWYSVLVPEASVLRVTVISTDPVRYQPVVSILKGTDEVACGLANDVKQASVANATAYVTPDSPGPLAGSSTYLVRVAEVANNSPLLGLPTLTVRFAGKDVTAPHIKVVFPSGQVQPGASATYDASDTSDFASTVNASSAAWEFHDQTPDGRDIVRPVTGKGLRVSYTWRSPGAHEIDLRVSDLAGNESMYRFYTFVRDTVPPQVQFSMTPPAPGARRMQIDVPSSESVFVRLVVTQVGKTRPLYRGTVKFWGRAAHHKRSIPLRGIVGRGLLIVTGVARDPAGNASALGQCWADPVSGGGQCSKP